MILCEDSAYEWQDIDTYITIGSVNGLHEPMMTQIKSS